MKAAATRLVVATATTSAVADADARTNVPKNQLKHFGCYLRQLILCSECSIVSLPRVRHTL